MERILATDKDVVEKAAETLKQGGTIVFPTDTAYGLGADGLSLKAIERVFYLKGRKETNPMHVVVTDRDMAARYAVMTDLGDKLIQSFLPGPLSLVLKKKDSVPSELVGGLGTIGIRIPDTPLALAIARAADCAYTATSANKSGDPAFYTLDEVLESFGERAEDIDLVIDAGDLSPGPVSTLVDVQGDKPVILREGPISMEDVLKVLE